VILKEKGIYELSKIYSAEVKKYDFTVSKDNETIYIECKGTRSNSNAFAITKEEWFLSKSQT